MSRRKFDCYMVHVDIGSHAKLAHLTDSEFRATVAGVFPLAATSPVRGSLLVGDLHVQPVHVSRKSGVTVRVAKAAMDKLRAVGLIVRDDELECERVHDFDDWNPAPKDDTTGAARQARYRERLRNQALNHADVTPTSRRNVTANVTASHADETPPRAIAHARIPEGVEGEGEVEGEATTEDASHPCRTVPARPSGDHNGRSDDPVVKELFCLWQEQCGHPKARFTLERRKALRARLKQGYTPQQLEDAIRGAAKAAYVDDNGKRHDDLTLICRNGAKVEDFIRRFEAVPPAPKPSGRKAHEAYLFERVAEWAAQDPDTDHTDPKYLREDAR